MIELRGLFEGWELGDAVVRREVLAALFDRLHVADGAIVGNTDRRDQHAEVLEIMEARRRRVFNVGGDGFEPTASSV